MSKSQIRWCVARLSVPHSDVRRKYAIPVPSGKDKMEAGHILCYHYENRWLRPAQPHENGVTP